MLLKLQRDEEIEKRPRRILLILEKVNTKPLFLLHHVWPLRSSFVPEEQGVFFQKKEWIVWIRQQKKTTLGPYRKIRSLGIYTAFRVYVFFSFRSSTWGNPTIHPDVLLPGGWRCAFPRGGGGGEEELCVLSVDHTSCCCWPSGLDQRGPALSAVRIEPRTSRRRPALCFRCQADSRSASACSVFTGGDESFVMFPVFNSVLLGGLQVSFSNDLQTWSISCWESDEVDSLVSAHQIWSYDRTVMQLAQQIK